MQTRRTVPLVGTLLSALAGAALTLGIVSSALAQGGPPLRIAMLISQTGPGAFASASGRVGAELARDEINKAGGILGRRVEFVHADDATDPTQALNEAIRLQNEKIDAQIGPQLTQLAQAITPTMNKAGITWFTTTAGAVMTPEFAPRHFSMLYSGEAQGEAMALHAARTMKLKRVAVLVDNSASSLTIVPAIRTTLAKHGVELTGTAEYSLRSQDMTPQLLALRRGNPEALLISAISGDDAGHLIKGMQDIRWNIPVVGGAIIGVLYNAIIKIAGPDSLKNASGIDMKAITYCTGDPVGQGEFSKFLAKVRAARPNDFEKLSLSNVVWFYDIMYLIKAAAEGAKSIDGSKMAAWIEENAGKVPVVNRPLTASRTSHFLIGPEALVPVENPGNRRSDGMLKRAGC
jgi:branched-chain amino acid transport system substrate-binding protein